MNSLKDMRSVAEQTAAAIKNKLKTMRQMLKTYMVVLPLTATVLLVSLPSGAKAQLAIAEVIKAGVKKVIKALDLKVQRLQNETIWLQNAQKVMENTLSRLKLGEISDWTGRQRELYAGYYEELIKVKSAITTYKRLRDLIGTQGAIVQEYRWASGLFKKDSHFSKDDLSHIEEVYEGILKESIKNLDQVFLVVNSFKTQMSDAARMSMIDGAAEKIEQNFSDLKSFNDQNISLSLQRSKSELELKSLKQLYGLE